MRLSGRGVPRQRTIAGKATCPRCARYISVTVNGVFVFHKCKPVKERGREYGLEYPAAADPAAREPFDCERVPESVPERRPVALIHQKDRAMVQQHPHGQDSMVAAVRDLPSRQEEGR